MLAAADVQRELRDASALEPLVAEVPVQTHAHGNALLPQVDEEHRPKHLGLELRAVNPREREEYRELEEADGVHGRPWEAHNVQARIFHEPGRGERFRLRHLDGSRGDAHGGCVSAPNRAATVAEAAASAGEGQVSAAETVAKVEELSVKVGKSDKRIEEVAETLKTLKEKVSLPSDFNVEEKTNC